MQALWGFRTYQTFGSGPLVVCSILLSALSLCLWCVVFECGSISRFKAFLAWFGAFVWVCVVCVLCVACVALYACGVRRIKGLWCVCLSFCPFAFLLLLLCLPPFMLVVLLCSGCLSLFSCIVFVAIWVWLLFPFPFRTTRKKKGRAVLVRPLLVCRECSNSCNVIEELRGRCFGSF